MKLSLPLAIVLALIANLVPSFGKAPSQQPASNDSPPQTQK